MIKNIKILSNENKESEEVTNILKKSIKNFEFKLVDENPDLVVAIGGDGCFIRAVNSMDFDENIFYTGINTGRLGFLQELNKEDINNFIKSIKHKIEVKHLNLLTITIKNTDSYSSYKAINEIVIRDKQMKKLSCNVYYNEEFLETSVGDGIIISSVTGSTAYAMNLGGAIVLGSDLELLQMIPIAAIQNNCYNSIKSPIITDKVIKIIPKEEVSLFLDGNLLNIQNTEEIVVQIGINRIKKLTFNKVSSTIKLKNKFLKK